MFRKLMRGVGLYVRKTGEFSHNARMVLLYSGGVALAFGVFQFLFNFYVLSLGFDETFVGTLQTTSSLAAIAMALPAAYLARRFSQQRLMWVTALISAFALTGVVLFPAAWPLIIFRMIAAMTMSLREVAVAPFLMANTKGSERQWVFSFTFGISTISMFVGSLLGGWLPSLLGGWVNAAPTDTLSYQLALGSMMLMTIFATGPIFRIRNARQAEVTASTPMPWRLVRNYKGVLAKVLLPQIIIGLGAGTMQPFMNIYFRKVYDQSDQVVSIVFALGGLAMAVAQFLGPPVADRYGKINTVILSQALSIPFLIVLGLGAWLAPANLAPIGLMFSFAALAFMVRLALMNMSNPVYQTFILEHVPEDVQTLAVSLNAVSFQFGWFVMPQVSGWLQVQFAPYGFVPVFAIVVVTYVIAIVVEWVVFADERRAPVPAIAD